MYEVVLAADPLQWNGRVLESFSEDEISSRSKSASWRMKLLIPTMNLYRELPYHYPAILLRSVAIAFCHCVEMESTGMMRSIQVLSNGGIELQIFQL